MLSPSIRAHKSADSGKNENPSGRSPGLFGHSPHQIKAHFVAQGTSLNRFAKKHRVSHALVSQLIHGKRPGRRGESRRVMAALRRELTRA